MMQVKPIDYKIAIHSYFGVSVKEVSGFAVDTIARICVRKIDRMWECTDYDTGYRIGKSKGTREACIKNAIEILERNIPIGSYAKGQKSALKLLKKEGLLK